ncbi:SusD-like protein P2 [Dyadobacter sp. CECT 9275]|uniref:SusD-like protein P2 n=1 Tax=Dyadobacter helix TaxID=2822344 RepID=A0A916J9D1_9BACT|nr:RagB/SusD family nutrient uptake outer membrane protein [Dyadobacter sp. CECT 9275]CAG4992358.1 SusD-like protein P2 [Dyadobacter sp. CECT 9275]
MKKYVYLFFLTCSFLSCQVLDEKVKGLVTPETYYTTAEELEGAVVPIYNKLVNLYDRTGRVTCAMYGADDVTTSKALPDLVEYEVFKPTGANAWLKYWWSNAYGGINSANNVIVNSSKVPDSEAKNQALGQAYFSRAWLYFYLVRIHNKIPLITDITAHPDIKRSEPKEVYDLIVSDLQKAEKLLPDSWTGYRSNIAMTSGTAKSTLSLVYLTMAGYPLKDESKYALAAEKAKEVIDNSGKWGYKLVTNFADLWTKQRFNDEIVFGLFYNNSNGDANQSAPLCGAPAEYSGWDYYFAELNFYKAFPAGARKDATFWTKFPIETKDSVVIKDWTQLQQKHPYYKKYIEIDGYDWTKPWVYIDWNSSRTNVLMRYAEVLLIYAEAKAMSGAPDATAYAAINQVRKRAGLADLTAGLNKEAFRDAVIAERGWEFAGLEPNGSRWFDLVRTEGVEKAAADRDASEIPLSVTPTKANYFAPIPDGEVLLNPNLAK